MRLLSLFFISLFVFSCSSTEGEDVSANEKMRDEVRSYLFLGDSIEVQTTVTDTITSEELDGMMSTVEENLNLIQMDIDTLEMIIDDLAYSPIDMEGRMGITNLPEMEEKTLIRDLEVKQNQLKLAQLDAQKLAFQQTKRVLLHLKRSEKDEVSGYEVEVSYFIDDEEVELGFVMNADYRIVD